MNPFKRLRQYIEKPAAQPKCRCTDSGYGPGCLIHQLRVGQERNGSCCMRCGRMFVDGKLTEQVRFP